ncbi:ABC transporter permease [Mesorhizobium sp. M7A.F.Ca.CA.001.09.2.1]|uniref:Binding-protein-dependent transport systems inner membrane component n=5 Tax=Mesorhizobium TaxID=68287 RepID=E8TE28_MESCW|nr:MULTISPECIES: ABC transporter permease [Mesorhizobium]RVA51063.1 ABC transporter permease [Mesorhizobium sp. M7A.F.Ca.US.001.01.1.1]ADV12200.1 binding-protein-dependent transport systems inner membrane component [Mesorhizobium ciceri biovar biserrulae WSM1271]ARP64820.1 peptide ABC transporter permease [Mesorhizobium sp. WSM1497]MBZ9891902.1 ABC transporter permease [Mesorhizobium sp. BR1-1-3]MDF3208537.1 ABC transporter permease [Mesorhizobium sp. LMG15046]
MLSFVIRRLGTMALTMLCLTMVVFFLINLEPNLKKLAISQTEMHTSAEQLESWLVNHGYRQNFFVRYGQWLGVLPKQPVTDPATGKPAQRFSFCNDPLVPTFAGVFQGDFGCSTKFKATVASKLFPALGATGILMFWVLAVMVPISLLIGILAGMREGSRTDRVLSVASIASTATPEYVSGVIFTVIFASWLGWLNGSAASASQGITFYNFTLPVMTLAIYGIGYIARMTRASMVEVMTQQYIRTARLKGLSFGSVVVKHALRNALIAPFTVIMLQFPWLLTGVVIVEVMFRYQGFGYTLVEAAGNNDIDLLLGCSLVSVFIVLITQLISDVGYAFLNPRIRVQ